MLDPDACDAAGCRIYRLALPAVRRYHDVVQLDDTICYCFHIRKRKILNFIRIHQPRRASQISECGGAGTGCGWCVPYLTRYFEEAQAGLPTNPDQLTPEEYARMRADYDAAKAKGRPRRGQSRCRLTTTPENAHAHGLQSVGLEFQRVQSPARF